MGSEPQQAPPKPGWQTSEFWLSVGALAAAVLAGWLGLSAADSTTLAAAISKGVVGVFSVVAAFNVVREYIGGRVSLKGGGTMGMMEQVAQTASRIVQDVSASVAPPAVEAEPDDDDDGEAWKRR